MVKDINQFSERFRGVKGGDPMSKSVGIDGIGQIHLSVDDLPRAVAFYRDVLGLALLFEVPGQSMAFFDCGGVRLYLGKPETESFRSKPVIYYRVAAIDDACAELERRGVSLESRPHVVHRTDAMELWMAGLRDPEGNAVVLMSEVARG
jgi:catechol 2,3-dioxygenase-like lactoylglutathione lyase family enzyme